jgi:hypothetical protein
LPEALDTLRRYVKVLTYYLRILPTIMEALSQLERWLENRPSISREDWTDYMRSWRLPNEVLDNEMLGDANV